MIRIVTDSTADIRGNEINKLNIEVVPLNVVFGDKSYADGIDLSVDEFYAMLASEKTFPKTSQPSPALFAELFEQAKNAKDELIYLGISSGLSGTVQSAVVAKEMVGYDKIYIVDTLECLQGLRLLVKLACRARDAGKSAKKIVEEIDALKLRIHIVSMIDTLEYLFKGGRLSRAMTFISTTLNIKPLIDLNKEGKIRVYGKTIGARRAMMSMLSDLDKNKLDSDYPVCFGYTSGDENLKSFMEKVLEKHEIQEYDVSRIGPTAGAHIGEGGFCMAYVSTELRK